VASTDVLLGRIAKSLCGNRWISNSKVYFDPVLYTLCVFTLVISTHVGVLEKGGSKWGRDSAS